MATLGHFDREYPIEEVDFVLLNELEAHHRRSNKARRNNLAFGSLRLFTDGSCIGNNGSSPGGYAALIEYMSNDVVIDERMISGYELQTTNNRMEVIAAIVGITNALEDSNCLNCISSHKESTPSSVVNQSSTLGNMSSTNTFPLITVITDSMYLKKGITEWIQHWKCNGWKTSMKQDVLNQDLWKSLDRLLTCTNIDWQWTKGHANCSGNQRVDSVANQQAQFAKDLLSRR